MNCINDPPICPIFIEPFADDYTGCHIHFAECDDCGLPRWMHPVLDLATIDAYKKEAKSE